MDERTALLERIAELEKAVSERDAKLEARAVEIEERDARIARLTHNVEALKRILWAGSEKRKPEAASTDPTQLWLAGILERALRGPETEGAAATSTIHVPAHTRKKCAATITRVHRRQLPLCTRGCGR